MTLHERPAIGQSLDVTAILCIALAVPDPPRPPGDAVPIRGRTRPWWRQELPTTTSWDGEGAVSAVGASTEVDWSLDEIERVEGEMSGTGLTVASWRGDTA